MNDSEQHACFVLNRSLLYGGGVEVEVREDDLGPFLFYGEANLTCGEGGWRRVGDGRSDGFSINQEAEGIPIGQNGR